jgi:GH35 family endo-1,4-beta-xylanase
MNLDFRQTFRQICHLGLHRVRLGAYWNVIEKQRGEYDFTELDWLLEQCAQHNIDVVLVVGMKVPRWPEFHFPQWVSDCEDTGPGYAPLDRRSPKVAKMALQFVEQVVHHCRTAPALKYWQIENG